MILICLGITVGAVVVPQGMAYAKLALLPVEFGLYSSFMGVLIYWFFATSKDITVSDQPLSTTGPSSQPLQQVVLRIALKQLYNIDANARRRSVELIAQATPDTQASLGQVSMHVTVL